MTLSLKLFNITPNGTTYAGERVLEGDPITIGRGSTCTLKLSDPEKRLSRVQVELAKAPGGYLMTVASQYFPVSLNGRQQPPGTQAMVHVGDFLVMDVYEMEVVGVEARPAPQPAAVVPPPRPAAPPPRPAAPPPAPAPAPAPVAAPAPAPSRPEPAPPPAPAPAQQPAGSSSRRFAIIGGAVAAVVLAAGIGFALMKGMGSGGDAARKAELDAARLDGEARSLLKLFDNDRRDLKEAGAQAAKDIERLEGQVRTARTPQEKAPLEVALREARDKAAMNTELEKKFRERTEGPAGLPKAEGNLNAAAVAVKGKEGVEALRLLNEAVASLTALRTAIGEDRKAGQAELQRLSEQRKREEPPPAAKAEPKPAPKPEPKVAPKVEAPQAAPAAAATKEAAQAKAKDAADAKAAAAEARSKAQADAKAAAEAKAASAAEARAKAQADAKAQAEAKTKALADAKAQAEAKARADSDARSGKGAAAKAAQEAQARAEAEAKAKAEADAKAKAEAEAKAKAAADAEKAAKDAKAEQYRRMFQQIPR